VPKVLVAVGLAGGIATLGAACTEDTSCELSFVVDGATCDVDDCVIDFGAVPPGLTETKRLSWSGACGDNILINGPVLNDGGTVFRLGESALFLGEQGDEGFVFVSAAPNFSEPATGTLDFDAHTLELVVNSAD
jgi:hypothetical protein